jgi:hypothetical protein
MATMATMATMANTSTQFGPCLWPCIVIEIKANLPENPQHSPTMEM